MLLADKILSAAMDREPGMTESLDENYARGGFHAGLEAGRRPAVLVIDMSRAYFEPSSPLFADVEETREAAKTLIAAARECNLPVIHTSVRYARGGADGGVFYRKLPALRVFDQGSPLGDFAEGVEPAPGELVIVKQYASAFFGTSLAATLVSHGIDTLVISGLTTSGCVRASVVDAISHGFIPLVVREAVGDRAEAPHDANLFDMSAKYADVIGLNQALSYLQDRRDWIGGGD
jgi:nicotinamidase-related amidase